MSVITFTKDTDRGKKGVTADIPYAVAKQMVREGAAVYTNPPVSGKKVPPKKPEPKPEPPKADVKPAPKPSDKPAEVKPEKPAEHAK